MTDRPGTSTPLGRRPRCQRSTLDVATLDGSIPPDRHLARCEHCQDTVAHLTVVQQMLAGLPPVPMPDPIADRLDQVIALEAVTAQGTRRDPVVPAQRGNSHRSSGWFLVAAAAAVLLLSGVGFGRGLGPINGRPGGTAEDITGSGEKILQTDPPADASGSGAGDTTVAERQSITHSARNLAAWSGPFSGARAGSPQLASALDSGMIRCLAVLKVAASELMAAGGSTLRGEQVTIVLLAADAARGTVDVRVVRQGCPHGSADIRYQYDGLRLP